MIWLIVFIGYTVFVFVVAAFLGSASRDAGELHDGATMRDQRRERYRQAREQENAAAAEFDRFGRGSV